MYKKKRFSLLYLYIHIPTHSSCTQNFFKCKPNQKLEHTYYCIFNFSLQHLVSFQFWNNNNDKNKDSTSNISVCRFNFVFLPFLPYIYTYIRKIILDLDCFFLWHMWSTNKLILFYLLSTMIFMWSFSLLTHC